MTKPELQNAIRVNMRGFLPTSEKRFVLCENKTGRDEFTVTLIHGESVEHTVVYRGKMTTEVDEYGEKYQVGDFSSVTSDGDYYITAGGFVSRQFVIYDKAYDNCQRMMLEYFTWQRCGHPLGWNGKCHTDDGYIKETGEHIDLSGGYHQSCDLRKSPAGVPIGVLSMMRFAVKDKSEWGEILVRDEVMWACDYFVKLIQDNGVMYNTMNDPFGWKGRIFYKSAAPSSGQWCVTSILALGYSYFKELDSVCAERYLAAAKRSYDYMVSDRRPSERYYHPDKIQRGYDPDNFFEYCQKGSSADLCYGISAAADLYRATGDAKYLSDIESILPVLLPRFLSGELAHILTESFCENRTVAGGCYYSWAPAFPLALLDAYEIVGDKCGLGEMIRTLCESLCHLTARSLWHDIKTVYSDADLDARIGHPKPGQTIPSQRECNAENLERLTEQNGQNYYCVKGDKVGVLNCLYGSFLARAAKLFGEKKFARHAQYCLDLILGTNPQDSSRIRGIGYNQVQHHAFGQFFPSTPFIPGAMGVAYSNIDVYSSTSEYDMPWVGMTMELIANICDC